MAKLSKAQQRLLDESRNTIDVLNQYETFEEFFDNCPFGAQQTFSIGKSFNYEYNTSEKYSTKNPEKWEEMKKKFYEGRDQHILIVSAKTETVKKLETLGFIQILKEAKWGYETIKVL